MVQVGAAQTEGRTMLDDFDIAEEVRRHPGIVAGAAAVIAGVAIGALLLNQRTGRRRYEQLMDRLDPRGWIDAEALRRRFDDISRGVADGVETLGDRAEELGDDARHGAGKWFKRGKKALSPSRRRRYAKAARGYAHDAGLSARRYADDAGRYARDHAKEGGALLAVATIAAAIGAAALESRRPDSHVRRIAKF
jgi:hypothetical protein